jgi:hypothetical protein
MCSHALTIKCVQQFKYSIVRILQPDLLANKLCLQLKLGAMQPLAYPYPSKFCLVTPSPRICTLIGRTCPNVDLGAIAQGHLAVKVLTTA